MACCGAQDWEEEQYHPVVPTLHRPLVSREHPGCAERREMASTRKWLLAFMVGMFSFYIKCSM